MRQSGVEIAPRLARAIVVVVSAALLMIPVVKGIVRSATEPGPGTAIALTAGGVFVLQLLQLRTLRAEAGAEVGAGAGAGVKGRALSRRTGRLLVAQLVLAFLAVVPLGVSVGVLCVPVGALLQFRRWALAALVVAGAGGVEVARAAGVRDGIDMTLTVALGGSILYGLTTLASLVTDVHTARLTLAMSAVAAERLRIAGALEQGLSDGLVTIRRLAAADPADIARIVTLARASLVTARATAADFRSLSLAPEAASARGVLGAAGIEADVAIGHSEPLGPAGSLLAMVLRESATAVVRRGDARRCTITTAEHHGRIELCIVDDGVPTAARGADELGDLPARVRDAGGRCHTVLDPEGRFVVEASVAATPAESPPQRPERGLVSVLYYLLLGALFIKTLLWAPLPLVPLAVPCVAAVCALQIRYSLHDARRGARLGLAALAVIAFAPLAWFGRNWIGVPGFLIGSLLIALRFAVSVPLTVAAMALSGLITGLHQDSAAAGSDAAANALVTGLIVYGLLRLARLAAELQDAGAALERAAVVQERLRAARDLHDLLGHSLAAVVLKAELAKRLAAAGTDDARTRARAELHDIVEMADRALADLRTVTGDPAEMALATELASAASVLAAADVVTEVDTTGEVPQALEAVTSAVLREAVTNILRHSKAANARIAVTVTADALRLEVENDGVSGTVTPPGSGIGGLGLRLADVGGTLSAGADDGWYVLRAEVPIGGGA